MTQPPVGLSVGGVTFRSSPAEGVYFAVQELEGWYEPAEMSVRSERRPSSPGQFNQAGLAGGKTITLNGYVRSNDRVLLTEAIETLAALLADGSTDIMRVYDDDMGYRWAPVQRFGQPSFDITHPGIIKFQIQFLAPDAYRYGQTSTGSVGFAASSGSGMVFPLFPDAVMDFGPLPDFGIVTVQNPGTADASPVFNVAGPTPAGGFTITDTGTGRSIVYLGVVPEGSTLTIDASTGAVVLDGVADRFGDALVEAWPVVPARSTRSFLFEPLSTATAAQLSVAVVATYW